MRYLTRDTRSSGFGWAVLSASSFALSGPLARGLLDAGWSSGAAVVTRILVGAACLAPAALVALRGRWSAVRANLPLIVAYGIVAVAGCQLAFFNAVARLPVGVALLIEYTSPVLVVGWMWLRHAERPGLLTLVGAVLAAGGLVLVLDLVTGAGIDGVGGLWAFVAALGGATYFVLSSRTQDGLPGIVLAAAGLLVGGIVLLAAGVVGLVPLTASIAPVTFGATALPWWVPVLGLGVVTAAIAYVTGIAATRRLGSRLASFVALLEVVAGMVFAAALLNEVPRAVQLAGGVLVLAGIVVVKLGEVDDGGRPDHDRHAVSNPEEVVA